VTSLRIKEASKKMRNIQTRRLGNTGKTLEDFGRLWSIYQVPTLLFLYGQYECGFKYCIKKQTRKKIRKENEK
jgi:hypothetical protein